MQIKFLMNFVLLEKELVMNKEKIEKYCSFLKNNYESQKSSIDTFILKEAKSASNTRSPLFVSWEITSNCNLSCGHCRAANNLSRTYGDKYQLNTSECIDLISDLKNSQVYTLGITGGEPFVREDIMDILIYAKKLSIQLIIYTNGCYITESIAEKLGTILSKEDIIHLSMDGGTEEDNDRQRGKGTFKKVLSALKLLNKYKLTIRLTIVPTVFNINSIKKLGEIAKEFGVSTFSAVPLMTAGRAIKNNLKPETEKLFDIEIEMINLFEGTDIEYLGGVTGATCSLGEIDGLVDSKCFIKRQGSERRICDAGTKQVFIDAYGNVYPCNLFASSEKYCMGNIKSDSIESIWKNKKWRVFSDGIDMKDTKCRKCKLWYLCNGGCMALSELHTGRLDTPDPRCVLND